MFSPPLVPDNKRKSSSAQWQQWGTWVLFVIAGIIIVLIFIGVTEGLFY
jgi:hypothetical protein